MLSLFLLVASIEPLPLQDALARAAANNLTLQQAQAAILRANGLLEEARSLSFPTLTANGNYTRLDGNREDQGVIFTAANQLYGNVTAQLPVIAPSAWARWGHASEEARIAALSEKETRRQVALQVAEAYLAIIAAQRVVELNQRAKESAQAHYDYTARRLAQGLGSKLDEVRAAQELRSDASQVESAAAGLLKAQAALGVLCGQSDPLDAKEAPRFEAPRGYDSAIKDATDKRPDLILLSAERNAAAHLVRDSWTDFMPQLVAMFLPAYQDPSTVLQPRYSWTFELVLTWSIYDGGMRYGLLKERRAGRDDARLQLDLAMLQTKSELIVGFEALKRAEAALSEAKAAAALANQAVQIADLSYRAGATTNLELIDAQRRARDAETTAVIADDNAQRTRLDLQTAAGRFP